MMAPIPLYYCIKTDAWQNIEVICHVLTVLSNKSEAKWTYSDPWRNTTADKAKKKCEEQQQKGIKRDRADKSTSI